MADGPRRLYCSVNCIVAASVNKDDECWHWLGSNKVNIDGTYFTPIHFMATQFLRPLAANEWPRRTCKTAQCVNPAHIKIIEHRPYRARQPSKDYPKRNHEGYHTFRIDKVRAIYHAKGPTDELAMQFNTSPDAVRMIKQLRKQPT